MGCSPSVKSEVQTARPPGLWPPSWVGRQMGLLFSQSNFQFCLSLHAVFSVETSLFCVAVDGLATGTPFLMTRICIGSRGCSSGPPPGLSSLWNWDPFWASGPGIPARAWSWRARPAFLIRFSSLGALSIVFKKENGYISLLTHPLYRRLLYIRREKCSHTVEQDDDLVNTPDKLPPAVGCAVPPGMSPPLTWNPCLRPLQLWSSYDVVRLVSSWERRDMRACIHAHMRPVATEQRLE